LLQRAEKRAEKEKEVEKKMGALTIGLFLLACTK